MSAHQKNEAEEALVAELNRLLLQAAAQTSDETKDSLAQAIADKITQNLPALDAQPEAPIRIERPAADDFAAPLAPNIRFESDGRSPRPNRQSFISGPDARLISVMMFSLGLAMLVIGAVLFWMSRSSGAVPVDVAAEAAPVAKQDKSDGRRTTEEVWREAAQRLRAKGAPDPELHCGRNGGEGRCQTLEAARQAWTRVGPDEGLKLEPVLFEISQVAGCEAVDLNSSSADFYIDRIDRCLAKAAR